MTEKQWKWPKMRTCLRRDTDHALSTQQAANNVQTRHPIYQKRADLLSDVCPKSRSIREFVRASSPRPALARSALHLTLPFLASALSQYETTLNWVARLPPFNPTTAFYTMRTYHIVLTKTKTPIHFHKQIHNDTHTSDRNFTVALGEQWGKRPTLCLMFPTWSGLPDIIQDRAWMR